MNLEELVTTRNKYQRRLDDKNAKKINTESIFLIQYQIQALSGNVLGLLFVEG